MMTQQQRVFLAVFLMAFGVALLPLLLSAPAWAQTVDVRPLAGSTLEWVATTLAGVLTVLAGFGVRFVSSKIGLANSDLEASLNARLNEIIHRGIDAAYMRALSEVNNPSSGLQAVKVDNIFIGWVFDYVSKAAPGILAKFNAHDRLRDMILARIPNYMPQLAGHPSDASPA